MCQPLVKTLLEVTRSDPASAAQMLWAESEGKRRTRKMIQGRKRRGRLLCASGQDCGKVTLPFSKFCLERECVPDEYTVSITSLINFLPLKNTYKLDLRPKPAINDSTILYCRSVM